MSGPNPPDPDSPAPDEPARDAPKTGETEIYSRAYSAPESEQFTSAPYVPPDSSLYDYDSFDPAASDDESPPPRWPWVVGVVAIVAAISLVVSVAVLVMGTESDNLNAAGGPTSTPSAPTA